MSTLEIVLAGIASYVAFLAAMAYVSQPIRLMLAEVADDMAAEPKRTKAERIELEWLVVSSSSSVIGLLLPIAALFTLASSILGARLKYDPELERMEQDPRFEKVIRLYFLSVAACSPFATLLAAPFIVLSVAVRAVMGERELVRVAEAPVMKASATFQSC